MLWTMTMAGGVGGGTRNLEHIYIYIQIYICATKYTNNALYFQLDHVAFGCLQIGFLGFLIFTVSGTSMVHGLHSCAFRGGICTLKKERMLRNWAKKWVAA